MDPLTLARSNFIVSGFGRLIARNRTSGPPCLVCHQPVLPGEPQMRFHGDTHVHRRCATFRMRGRRTGAERLGFPPR